MYCRCNANKFCPQMRTMLKDGLFWENIAALFSPYTKPANNLLYKNKHIARFPSKQLICKASRPIRSQTIRIKTTSRAYMKSCGMARTREIVRTVKNSRFGPERTVNDREANRQSKKQRRSCAKTRKSRNHLSTKHTAACRLNQ